jgi:hypothetical protein
MAAVTEKVLPHLESMQPDSILDRVNDIEKYDRLARRNYGLSDKGRRLRHPKSKHFSRTRQTADCDRANASPDAITKPTLRLSAILLSFEILPVDLAP